MKNFRWLQAFCVVWSVVLLLPIMSSADTQVVKIGDTTYDTLQAAVAAANDGDTIVLLKDIGIETDPRNQINASISIDKSLIIDGTHHGIHRTTGYLGALFEVQPGHTLTLKDLLLDGGGDGLQMSYTIKTANGYAGANITVNYPSTSIVATDSFLVNNGDLQLDNVTMQDFIIQKDGGNSQHRECHD